MSLREVRLSEVLTPVSRPVAILPGRTYRLLGAQWYAKGLFEREKKDGSEIRAETLFEVKAGDFVYNRLFGWKGSFALASSSDEGGLVSNEFPCFLADPSMLDPAWLRWFFTQEQVWDEVLSLSSGGTPTSRNRLKEERFLSMKIRLPPLPEQHRIVARLERFSALVSGVADASLSAGYETKALLQAARRKLIGDEPQPNWLPLRTYVEEIENGWSPLAENRIAENSEWAVLKVGSVSFGSFKEIENKALPPHLTPRAELEVRPGDFLMSRANTTELVGACVLVERTRPRLMLSDKLFRFHFREKPALNRRFLLHVLRSPGLRRRIESAATGTSPTMKNISKEKVLELLIPPASLEIQQKISDSLDGLDDKAVKAACLRNDLLSSLDLVASAVRAKALSGVA